MNACSHCNRSTISLRRVSWRDCPNFQYILQVGSMMSDDGMSVIFQPTLIFRDGEHLPSRSPKFMPRGIRKIDVEQCLRYPMKSRAERFVDLRARSSHNCFRQNVNYATSTGLNKCNTLHDDERLHDR